MFRSDSLLMRLLDRLGTLLILNLLFLLCSLPIVTVGAASTALYTVTLREARGDARSILSGFFTAFRKNFWKATLLWLIVLLLSAIFFVDLILLNRLNAPVILRYCLYIGGFFFASMLPYLFALQARFENSLRQTLRNALALGVAKLPATVLMLFLMSLPLLLMYLSEELFLRLSIFWFLLGFSLTAQLCSILLTRIFAKLTPTED